MNKRRSRSALSRSLVIEVLDSRIVLSGMSPAGALPQGAAEVAAQAMRKSATQTTLAVGAGTLGQPVTFSVTVRGAAAAGLPSGTVDITDHGKVIQTLTLSPATPTSARYALVAATGILTQPPGSGAYYFGKHAVSATFIPSGPFQKSTVSKSFTVSPPAYTALAGGVKVATIAPGSGAAIQAGQTANVLYTGYLASNGRIFDDSLKDGGTPFSFAVGAGQVIPGFDEGTVGMQAGETRILMIPAAQAYGAKSGGLIPPNSNLVFVLTLESIS